MKKKQFLTNLVGNHCSSHQLFKAKILYQGCSSDSNGHSAWNQHWLKARQTVLIQTICNVRKKKWT